MPLPVRSEAEAEQAHLQGLALLERARQGEPGIVVTVEEAIAELGLAGDDDAAPGAQAV